MVMATKSAQRIGLNSVAALVVFLMAFPVYWMATTAFKQTKDINSTEFKFFPVPGTLQHFRTALSAPDFLLYARNSVVVATSVVLLSMLFALFAATALARFQFKGRKMFVILLLIVQMVPLEALVIPMFLVLRDADQLNRLPALVATYLTFVLPFSIWTLRGFVAAIPVELDEAAMVDGCTRAQAFRKVLFPLIAPGLVATSIFAFIQAWNELVFALTLLPTAPEGGTLPVWLTSFSGRFGTDWGGIMASSALFTLPVVVFFLFVQKRIASGMTAGAVKG